MALEGMMLPHSFFQQTPLVCAQALTGAGLCWNGIQCRIVETEAYDAEDDPACHTFSRPSARKFVETHPAGTAYVYLNYGVHYLFNVLIKGGARSGFVLIRAVEPLCENPDVPLLKRSGAGPGKLTKFLGITKEVHGQDLCKEERFAFFALPQTKHPVQSSGRIGISRAQDFPWRFYLEGNKNVSGPRFNLAISKKDS